MRKKSETRPSIFNDVMGPIMRGPSSSHTAASWRIARTCIELLGEPMDSALVEFDKAGIWASNYEEQGTVLGMSGGLLGIEMTDDNITGYEDIARQRNLIIKYQISSFNTDHPNTVRLTLKGKSGKEMQFVAVSTGGGMFEIRLINNYEVAIRGDYHEVLIFPGRAASVSELQKLSNFLPLNANIFEAKNGNPQLIQIKSVSPLTKSNIEKLEAIFQEVGGSLASATPVLPVISGNETAYPFNTIESLLSNSSLISLSLGDLGIEYEKARSGWGQERLINMMSDLIGTVEESIKNGLGGTEYENRILHRQSHLIKQAESDNLIGSTPIVNSIIANITAIMEVKSSMGTIVAIPTAGSCGTFGGTVKAFTDSAGSSIDKKVKAYFAGGLVGVFFAEGPGFSAECFGCQVETGIASAMTSAALVELAGGSAGQALAAASMAMQNLIGLVCDPVADRVEVPCLGKNVSAGMNAMSCHLMALSGFDQVIPLNEVIDTVEKVGNMIPASLRCTGKGGLAVTPTSVKIKRGLKGISGK